MTVQVVAKLIGAETVVHEPTVVDFMRRRELKSRDEVSDALINMANSTGDS